ncbi:MAG TPA: acetylglutamate kinase [Chloroflexia bacterium]|jgi:acetylglutamate kinase|nr:acetylglutamate kinase [Chloroflexia bacterium]
MAGATTDPALEAYRGKRFVVKLGGEVMQNAVSLRAMSADIALMSAQGVGVVVVHGGGPQADALTQKLGHTVRKVQGRRVTDDAALEVIKMVYGGSINLDMLAALRAGGAKAVGLSGVDAALITVTRRPPTVMRDPQTGLEELVDFGHVGDLASVDIAVLDLLLGAGYVPVVASLASDTEGNIYNINADTVATALAKALDAGGLYLVTNVPGILRDPSDRSSLLPVCTTSEAHALIENGAISGGMLPKVQNCLSALRGGVKQVRILDGSREESLLLRSLVSPGVGTVVIDDK